MVKLAHWVAFDLMMYRTDKEYVSDTVIIYTTFTELLLHAFTSLTIN
jgi:hypothetical protein